MARRETGKKAEAKSAFYDGVALMKKHPVDGKDKGLLLLRAGAARKLGIRDD